jgi:hypothetical protein
MGQWLGIFSYSFLLQGIFVSFIMRVDVLGSWMLVENTVAEITVHQYIEVAQVCL